MTRPFAFLFALGISFLLVAVAAPVLADGGVTFTEVDAANGITFQRALSPDRLAVRLAVFNSPIFIPNTQFQTVTIPNYAMKVHGVPGVALLDYDGDGDLDVYVTNGPGTPNSLYSNQLVETGSLTFVDVAAAAGVDATGQDSSGVCFGDIDNDGDPDLYVLAIGNPFHLFRNEGDGTFTDITDSETAGQSRHANGCTMADVDNDGLLDIVVANSYDDWLHRLPSNTPGPTYPGMEHNFLFVNQGGGSFADVSFASGLENVSNMAGPGLSGAGFTWAVGAFDYDQDGDVDLLSADNQGRAAQTPSERRGWLRLFDNDGSGFFTDVTQSLGLAVDGGWMGVTFGDYDCDGNLDFFATNIGDYLGGASARSAFYYSDGTSFAFAGPSQPNPFGWGTSTLDYDNDGDLDVIYHGSVDRLNFIGADNPGVLLQNQGVCSGNFDFDVNAFTVDHAPRNVQGVATGDVNGDGFPDMVSASAFNIPLPNNLYRTFAPRGTALDGRAFIQFVMFNFRQFGGWAFAINFPSLPGGNLSVEINNAENGNNWIKVGTRGSIDTLADGAVNRDGIGAVVKFTPEDGPTVTRPIVGGSSYASQDSLEIGFGMGSAKKGDLEVLWPGGVRNSLRGVKAGESVLLPEIPCSFDSDLSFQDYHACVTDALDELIGQGVLPVEARGPFLSSALDAYLELHP